MLTAQGTGMGLNFSKKDFFILLLICGFCLYLFRHIILGGHLLFGSDFNAFYLAMKQFLYNEIHNHGSIPFWNPYIFGGMPFWAHFESTIFYPLGLLFWLISPPKAYGYTMFIHLTLAGIFMYMLGRSLDINRVGSFISGMVFTCNGFIMSILHGGQMCPVQSYVWLPLIILFLHRAASKSMTFLYSSLAGMFWGIQILAGAPQDAFYTFFASFLFLLFHIKLRPATGRHNLNIIGIMSVFFLIGAALSSAQIIPAFEFIEHSVRASIDSYRDVTSASYPPKEIITVLLPHFFGDFSKNNYWVADVPWSISPQTVYIGVLPILLLFCIKWKEGEDKKYILFLGSLAFISLILALGHHTPVYRFFYVIPGFDRFRAPSKIIVLWVFASGLLAGKGMNDLFRSRGTVRYRWVMCHIILMFFLILLVCIFYFNRKLIWIFFSPFVPREAISAMAGPASGMIIKEFDRFVLILSSFMFVLFLWKAGRIKKNIGIAILCGILIIDLGYVYGNALKYDDKIYALFQRVKENLNIGLGSDKEIFRVGSYPSDLGPNIEMYLGYQTVGGFTALFLNRYYEYVNKYTDGSLPEGWQYFFYGRNSNNKIFMDLLNVKYEIFHDSRRYLFRDTYLPRAFFVPEHRILPRKEVLEYMATPDFDPKKNIILEEGTIPPDGKKEKSKQSSHSSLFRIKAYRPDNIIIQAESSSPGYLFTSEIYYPGWKALVDNKPAKIFRGDYIFRVICLPEGKHVIKMYFDPLSIKIGIGVSTFCLFFLINILIYHLRRRRQNIKREYILP